MVDTIEIVITEDTIQGVLTGEYFDRWILRFGFWDDGGIWDDSAKWID